DIAGTEVRADQMHSVPPRELIKKTRLSTDQNGLRFDPFPSVRRRRLDPSALMIHISCWPLSLSPWERAGSITEANASCRPSGLQDGLMTAALVETATS